MEYYFNGKTVFFPTKMVLDRYGEEHSEIDYVAAMRCVDLKIKHNLITEEEATFILDAICSIKKQKGDEK